jgi:hypothetical protein
LNEPPPVAVLMMQKNEGELLRTWLAYYGSQFGTRSLYIFDDVSDDPETINALNDAAGAGATVFWNPRSEGWKLEDKGACFSNLMEMLREKYAWFIPVDCDEFIAVDLGNGVALGRDAIMDEVDRVSDNAKPYLRVANCYNNIPGTTEAYRQPCKKTVIKASTRRVFLDHGLHVFDWSAKRDFVDPSMIGQCRLTHVHFDSKPYQRSLVSSREKLKNLVPDFSRETLQNYRGDNYHAAQMLLMTEAEYYERFAFRQRVDISAEFTRFGLQVPFSKV